MPFIPIIIIILVVVLILVLATNLKVVQQSCLLYTSDAADE